LFFLWFLSLIRYLGVYTFRPNSQRIGGVTPRPSRVLGETAINQFKKKEYC
jgi:hypothetical protein